MTVNISLVQPGAAGSVPRVCAPFAPVPQSSVPRVGPPPPPPPDERLPVMTVGGARPDRTGNVDLAPFLQPFSSHVADISVHHTSVQIAAIAGEEVAKVVNGAPAVLDTLKEIADYLAGTEAGSVASRLAALESGKASKSEMSVTDGSDATRKTVQLKSGLSQSVLVEHQDISGKRGVTDLAVYETVPAGWTFSDGIDREVLYGREDPDDPSARWYVTTADNEGTPQFYESEAEARASTSFGITLHDQETGEEIPVTATWSPSSEAPVPGDSLVKSSDSLFDNLVRTTGMSVTPVIGDSTKRRLALNPVLAQDVVVEHQDISGKRDVHSLDFEVDEWLMTSSTDQPGASPITFVRKDYGRHVYPGRKVWWYGSESGYHLDLSVETWNVLDGSTGDSVLIELETAGADATSLQFTTRTLRTLSFTRRTASDRLALGSQLPAASADTPEMDSGNGAAGTSEQFARGDHVHPSDAAKLDGATTYPAWISGGHQYYAGDVVSYGGSLYLCTYETSADVSPDLFGTNWSGTTIDALKQDKLSQSQMAAVAKAGKAVLTLSISSTAGYTHPEQSVVVDGRTFPQSTWANRPPIVLAGAERAEIYYGGYAADCSVRLNGADVGKPGSVVLEADSLLEVHFADCLHPDTPILMADGTRKRVADVRAGDRVATPFGPDEVTRTSSGRGARMDEWQFSDGTTVRTVGRHRFWNADLGEFMYLEAWNVGERAVRTDGMVAELVSRRTSEGDFPHATLFTARWNVYYAGGLVAGNRKSARLWR